MTPRPRVVWVSADFLPGPEISERYAASLVRVGAVMGRPVVYTLDGSVPTASSRKVEGPVEIKDGGVLQAAALGRMISPA